MGASGCWRGVSVAGVLALGTAHDVLIHDVLFLAAPPSRVLNLVTHRLLKKEADVLHLSFLRCSELLTEIEDDLTDYEEDVGTPSTPHPP